MLLKLTNILIYLLLTLNVLLGVILVGRQPIAEWVEGQFNQRQNDLEELLFDQTGLVWKIDEVEFNWRGLNPTVTAASIQACLPGDMLDTNSIKSSSLVASSKCSLDLKNAHFYLNLVASALQRGPRFYAVGSESVELTIEQAGLDLTLAGLDTGSRGSSVDSVRGLASTLKQVDFNKMSFALVDKSLDWRQRSTWPSHSLTYFQSNERGIFELLPLDHKSDFVSARIILLDDEKGNETQNTKGSFGWRGYVYTSFDQTLGADQERVFNAPYQSLRMQIDTGEKGLAFNAIIGSLETKSGKSKAGDVSTDGDQLSDTVLAPLVLSGYADVDALFSGMHLDPLHRSEKQILVNANWTPLLAEELAGDSALGGGSFELLEQYNELTMRFEQGHFFLQQGIDQFELVFRPVGRLKQSIDSLQPRGKVDYFSLEMPLNKPDNFVAFAKLNGVSVNSFNGKAPHAENVYGWLSFSRRSGALTMVQGDNPTGISFPQVYRQTLRVLPKDITLKWYVAADRFYLSGDQLQIDYLPFDKKLREGTVKVPVAGRFFVDGRRHPDQPSSQLSLEIGSKTGRIESILGLVPYRINNQVHEWLAQSKVNGGFSNASFLYYGSLNPRETSRRSFAFASGIDNAEFNFHPEWSRISKASGGLLIDSSGFSAQVDRAQLAGLEELEGQVELRRNPNGSKLLTSVNYDHKAQDLYDFLLISPVRERVPNQIIDWELEGVVTGQVDIELSYQSTNSNNQRVTDVDDQTDQELVVITKSITENLSLKIPTLDLQLTDINGEVDFSTREGFSADGVAANIWGQPIKINLAAIDAVKGEGEEKVTGAKGLEVSANGKLDVDSVLTWLFDKDSALYTSTEWIDGTSEFDLNYRVDQHNTSLAIRSDLVGTRFNLPRPFDKTESQPNELLVSRSGAVAGTGLPIRVGFGDKLNATLKLSKGELEGLDVQLYPRHLRDVQDDQQGFGNQDQAKFRVHGYLPSFNSKAWLKFSNRYNLDVERETTDSNPAFFLDNLLIQNMSLQDWDLSSVTVSVLHGAPETQIAIRNSDVDGKFVIPQVIRNQSWSCDARQSVTLKNDADTISAEFDAAEIKANLETINSEALPILQLPELPENLLLEKRLRADIKYLQLDKFISGGLSQHEDDGRGNWLNPDCLFPLTARIAKLDYAQREWGGWEFYLSTGRDVALVHNIKGSFNGMQIESVYDDGLRWAYRPDGRIASEFNGSFSSKKIDQSLKTYLQSDDSPILAKSASARTSLSWEGDPTDIALNRVEGSLDFDLRDGQFVEVSGAADGFLKLVSLVNLQRYISRLSLDVSSIYKDGISFDKLDGSVSLDQGKISFIETPISMKATSNDFSLTGEADFVNSSVDGELVATLPVSRNLPWLVAIAGGLPVAAGAFIATQALDDQINRFSSVVYTVSGELDDPQLNLKTMFSNETGTDKKDIENAAGEGAKSNKAKIPVRDLRND